MTNLRQGELHGYTNEQTGLDGGDNGVPDPMDDENETRMDETPPSPVQLPTRLDDDEGKADDTDYNRDNAYDDLPSLEPWTEPHTSDHV